MKYTCASILFVLYTVTPHTRCRLKLLKVERIKDFLLMEEELIRNMEHLKPQEQRNEVHFIYNKCPVLCTFVAYPSSEFAGFNNTV